MGAWDHTIFDNDTACDWIYDVEESDDLSVIEETIDKLLECEGNDIEAPEAEEALAAIETITRLIGNGGEKNSYTESLDSWVASHPQEIPQSLIENANKAIGLILSEQSELRELWAESDETGWKKTVVDLQERLNK